MKKRIVVITLIVATSLAVLLYPFFANIHNNKVAESLNSGYSESVADVDPEILAEALEEAQAYNAAMLTGGTSEYDYNSLLNINGDGMMGTLYIPSIAVKVPIFHGTSDDVLQDGAGHLESSSLPVGGTSTHAVLSAHRGLIGNTLFTYLDQLEEGDVFYIYVLGKTLAYEVTEIQTVLPTELDALNIRTGEDLVTLVTCTPYGINTHRLLVTGTRIDYTEGDEDNTSLDIDWFSYDLVLLYIAALEVVIYVIYIVILTKQKRRRA